MIQKRLEEQRSQYESTEKLQIACLTWNLAGQAPPTRIESDILPPGCSDVDFFIVGFQELVKLEVIGSIRELKDEFRVASWEQLFSDALKKRLPHAEFKCIMRKVMFGCLILFFCKEAKTAGIKKMCTSKVKTGVKGMAANKGSTSLRFNYWDTTFLFLNCHLSSGQKKVNERMDDLNLCYSETMAHFQKQGEEHRAQDY
jgi:phosphatidylinositol-3,4,5-trisphosphate 5-phosphatase 2